MNARVLLPLAALALAAAPSLYAQGHPVDWAVFGGDAQRTGWEKSDTRITRDNAKDLELLYTHKIPNRRTGPRSLTPPVVVGMLISYRGFKELTFVADSSDNLWAFDADLNRVFWQRHFDVSIASKAGSSACAKFATAMPALVPPITFGAPKSAGPRRPSLPGNRFGEVRPVFAVSSDGKLHKLNTSNGEDMSPPIDFLPAGAKASPLTIHDGTVYATTLPGCTSTGNGLFAIDLTAATPAAVSFLAQGKTAPAFGTPAFGTDGTVYVPTGDGASDPATNEFPNSLLAFTPNDLQLKGHFVLSEPTTKSKEVSIPAPVVFPYKNRDLIVTASSDGRLTLWDSASFGPGDHQTPLSQTMPLSAAPHGVRGGLSSWAEPDGTRWVIAPVWGPLNPAVKLATANGAVSEGALVAFKLDEENGKPVLHPTWISRGMPSPAPPVITGGVIFALSPGVYSGKGQPKGSTHATLYALDAVTGQELYSSGDQIKGPATLTGLTVANGRIFFATTDNTLYAFGAHFEI